MSTEQILKPAGLFTDPNPLTTVPRGALREATNVVIRRDGTIDPRPGFKEAVPTGTQSMTGTPYRMIPWKNDIVYTTSAGTWVVDAAALGVVTPGAAGITGLAYGTLGSGFAARAAEARNNLYITTTSGLRKLTSRTVTASESVGINGRRHVLTLSLQGSSGWFTTGNFVAYRACIQRRTANNVVVTSSPTGRYVLENVTGSGRTATVFVGLADIATGAVAAGDDLLLYRSLLSPGYPSDTLFLAMRYTVTAADIAATTITLQDILTQADLGDALYTNEEQEGIEQANDPPPRAQDVALFRSSVFLADTDGPRRLVIVFNAITNNTRTGVATGIGYRQFLGDTTITSPVIINVTSTVGIVVGAMIDMAGIPSGSLVTAVTATTITVNANATATAAGITGFGYDTITLQGGGTFAVDTPMEFVDRVNRGSSLSTLGAGVPSTYYRASLLSDFNGASSGTEQFSAVLIEEKEPNTAAIFSLRATHNTEYQPVLRAIGTADATVDDSYVDSNDIPNGLIYSKPDQPEAYPGTAAGNVIRVGSSSHRVDRILATRDALWIFKRDGIFRLTGAGANSGWRVDPFDMTHFLIASDSAVVMGDAIFAWTNRGVVRISDAGVKQISALAIGDQLQEQERVQFSTPYNTYASSVISDGWAVANTKDSEYWLCVGLGGEAPSSRIYVYNTKTLAWTRWDMRVYPSYHSTIDGNGRAAFAVAKSGAPIIDYERIASELGSDESVYADHSYTGVTCTAAAGTGLAWVITLSGAVTGYAPAVGDYVLGAGAQRARITAVASSTEFTVLGDSFSGVVSVSLFEKYECDVEFVAKIGGSASNAKAWSGGAVMFGSTRNMSAFDVSFSSSVSTTATTVSTDVDGWPDNDEDLPWSSRFWVSRAHTRSSVLFPRVVWNQARAHPRIYGISLANAAQAPQARR